MKTLICRHCGCSLARLGISKDQSTTSRYEGEEYRFCCRACADRFITDPQRYLQETSDVIVCPTCLGEKPVQRAVKLKIAGQEVHFCRCPSCPEAFQKNPNFYIERLEGTIPNEGVVVNHEGRSVRPEQGSLHAKE